MGVDDVGDGDQPVPRVVVRRDDQLDVEVGGEVLPPAVDGVVGDADVDPATVQRPHRRRAD